MKKIFTLLTIFIAINLYAQNNYYKVKILFTNGQEKEGYSQFPKNDLFYDELNFKESMSEKTTTIKHDAIKKISYYTDGGGEYQFERLAVRQFYRKNEKTTKHKNWLLIIFASPEITYYYLAGNYSIDKNGNLISGASDYSGTWAEIPLLFKRPEEKVPTIICAITSGAQIIGKEKTFRKTAMRYFSEEDSLIKRIEAKEFTTEDMIALAKAYTTLKENDSSQK